MIGRDIIVIGASLGGVEALTRLVHDLPPNLNAAVFIVLHIGAAPRSWLPQILSRAGPLPASNPRDCDEILPGQIYVAPPDEHLMIEPGHVRLVHGPKENRTRPAIDPLFRSAAIAYGPRVVGVVLTGNFDDGTAGLLAIKDRGGIAMIQDPAEAFAPSMPENAAACVAIDHSCRLTELTALLIHYDPPPLDVAPPVPPLMAVEHKLTAMEMFLADEKELALLGSPSGLTCPECGSVLYELHDQRVLRFRCRSGHAVSAQTLLNGLTSARENALWSAVRSMTEEASLARRLAEREQAGGRARAAESLTEQSIYLVERADGIRKLLGSTSGLLKPDRQ